MADAIEKRLITTFAEAWGEMGATLLGRTSTLGLLALRDVSGDGVEAALAVAATWSSGFFANCSGALPGVLVCLFKNEDSNEIERLMKQAVDGLPKPGGRALMSAVLDDIVARFASEAPFTFSEVKFLELSGQEARLVSVIGDKAWVGTFALAVGDELETQALLLYGPNGSLQAAASEQPVAPVQTAAPPSVAPSTAPTVSRRTPRREEPTPRNLERLLGVELEIIVRFGTTTMPLRDVVRLGTGMMIELNRAVDEPVELLVNNRPLARGEVVVIDGYYGVRITEIGAPSERPLTLIASGGTS